MASRLHQGFFRAAEAFPDRPAIELGTTVISYAELRGRVQSVAATLQSRRGSEGSTLTAVLGSRTVAGFVGILGALASGHGYVPMLPTYPATRLAYMIDRAQTRSLVVDAGGLRVLSEVLDAVAEPLLVVSPEEQPAAALLQRHRRHTFVGPDALAPAEAWTEPTVGEDDIAYLLFTSGSTGQPKGVMVAHRNIARFLDFVVRRYDLGPRDRFSHLFDVTFDLSLFDLFAAWEVGGCLCCPTPAQRMLPAKYVVDAGLSVWFSVPSTALLMHETRTLPAGALEGLRLALFCGEALPATVADAFAAAAPRAVVENLYGPTELTLACTLYRIDADHPAGAPGEVVPIGWPFEGMDVRVVDEALREVDPGQTGELLMAGPQLTLGYWRDPERTAAAFVVPPGEDRTFYRTGDRVIRPVGDDPIRFLGRLDAQVKIRGYRVELGEIEVAVRELAGTSAAVALGWPPAAAGGAEGVVAFVDDPAIDVKDLQRRLAARLPRYMVPRRIEVLEAFPLNQNGKIDRNALRAWCEKTLRDGGQES